MNGNELTTNRVFSVNQLAGIDKWQAKQDCQQIVKNTLVVGVHEQGRAILTDAALQNVGALSALEEHLCQIAPSGAPRYHCIVDAYALGAAQTIARW